jgi:ABC-type transport system involved in multi-copper enzyme maturation permease subunit
MGLMAAVLIIMFGVQQGVRDVGTLADMLKAPLMYFVQMSLLAAVAIFFSTFVSPLVNFFLSGGLYLLGSLFNPFFQTLEENQATPVVAKAFAKIVNTLLPNFANYNVQNPIINPTAVIQNERTYYITVTIYGLFYIGILLVLGILVFDRREV